MITMPLLLKLKISMKAKQILLNYCNGDKKETDIINGKFDKKKTRLIK